jgi:hypothetical protein
MIDRTTYDGLVTRIAENAQQHLQRHNADDTAAGLTYQAIEHAAYAHIRNNFPSLAMIAALERAHTDLVHSTAQCALRPADIDDLVQTYRASAERSGIMSNTTFGRIYHVLNTSITVALEHDLVSIELLTAMSYLLTVASTVETEA